MFGPLLVAAGVVLSGFAAYLATSQARRVRGATSGEAEKLTTALRRLPTEARVEALRARAPTGSWERNLAEDLAGAREDERLAVANDALAELAHALDAGASWPQAAVRIAAFGSMLLAVLAYLATLEFRWPLTVLAVGAIGVAVCFEAAGRARTISRRQREQIDGLVEQLLGGASRELDPRPVSRRRGRR